MADTRVNWGTGVDAGGSGTGHTSGSARVLQFDWALENPFRQMIVTSNQNPAGLTPFADPRQFGFSVPRPFTVGGRWGVYHEDGSAMSPSARFNVWAPCAGGSWYPDGDGDGYGVEAVPQASCAPLPGYAARLGDCDDSDATRYPGSPEINDGRDNQCAGEPGYGLVDEIAAGTGFYDLVTLCWPGQTGAILYQVARSTSGAFSPCTYLLSTSGTCLTESDVPAAGEAYFYLVRAESPWPGNWGVDSAGQERLLACQ